MHTHMPVNKNSRGGELVKFNYYMQCKSYKSVYFENYISLAKIRVRR